MTLLTHFIACLTVQNNDLAEATAFAILKTPYFIGPTKIQHFYWQLLTAQIVP
jgi:hypothetical protein